jgi:hypothetical protein
VDDPEKVESRGLSFSVTPDLKNGSFVLKIKRSQPSVGAAEGCDLLILLFKPALQRSPNIG